MELEEPRQRRQLTGPVGQVFRPVGQVLKAVQAKGAEVRSPPRVEVSALLSEGMECRAPARSPLQRRRRVLHVKGTEQSPPRTEIPEESTPGPLAQTLGQRVQVRAVLPLGELLLGERGGPTDMLESARVAPRQEGTRQNNLGHIADLRAPKAILEIRREDRGMQIAAETQSRR